MTSIATKVGRSASASQIQAEGSRQKIREAAEKLKKLSEKRPHLENETIEEGKSHIFNITQHNTKFI